MKEKREEMVHGRGGVRRNFESRLRERENDKEMKYPNDLQRKWSAIVHYHSIKVAINVDIQQGRSFLKTINKHSEEKGLKLDHLFRGGLDPRGSSFHQNRRERQPPWIFSTSTSQAVKGERKTMKEIQYMLERVALKEEIARERERDTEKEVCRKEGNEQRETTELTFLH